jgi:hypothetical protein
MRRITLPDFIAEIKAQGVAREDVALICPMCGRVQSMRDLVAAGAGKSVDDVERFIGFSCIGRWTDAGPPRNTKDGKGCNWTLGGLFKLHDLEVVDENGQAHPRFEIASPEQAQAHAKDSS